MNDITLASQNAPQTTAQNGASAQNAANMGNATMLSPTALPGNGQNQLLDKAKGFFGQPAVQKSLPLIAFLGVVAMAVMAWAALREPPQRDLFRGLPDNDKAAVAEALKSSNIAYQLDSLTGAITVSEENYHNAKMALAAQGLPRSAPSGDDLISNMPMGASRAVEGEKLRSAREMDLAQSIEALDLVISARVHLAVEPPSIFIRDRNQPGASVILKLANSARLSDVQVSAIVHLVSSSVPGLSPEGVSVVDQNGRLLSDPSEKTNNSLEETEQQLRVREQVEDNYRRNLIALLTPVLGEGNFVAEVSADVDFTERQATSESFPADGSRVRNEQRKYSKEETGNNDAAGIPGAIANTPPEAEQVNQQFDENGNPIEDENSKNGIINEEVARNYEIGRELAVTKNATGRISRLSVAVAIRNLPGGKERSAKEMEEIENLVKGAVGYKEDRGDQVAISSRAFQAISSSDAETPWYEASWMSMVVRNASALLVALAIIFGIGRPILKKLGIISSKKRKKGKKGKNADADAEDSDETTEKFLENRGNTPLLNHVENNTNGMDGASYTPSQGNELRVTLDMINAADSYQARALLIQNFVRQNPDHATLVVRDLLKSGNKVSQESEAENV